MPTFDFEKKYIGLIAGTDEAGRGPWVGPVVAAAVCFPDLIIPQTLADELNDSKKLSAKKREKLFPLIYESGAFVGVGQASAEEIDSLNILQASFLAMRRALDEVEAQGHAIDFVLIDGNRKPADWKWQTQEIIGGDGKSLSIAAASILAKVTRDRIMIQLAKKYPGYGWEKNAGYGTKAHQAGLAHLGITPEHRQSYAPIQKLLQKKA